MDDVCQKAKTVFNAALVLECEKDDLDEYQEKTFDFNNPTCAEYVMNKLAPVVMDQIYYGLLGWCGCGCPDDAYYEVYKYLKARQLSAFKEIYGFDNVYSNPLLLCLAYTLDNIGFTDHGGNIGGAWLTEMGTAVINMIEVTGKFPTIIKEDKKNG